MQMIYSFLNEENQENFYLCQQIEKNKFKAKKIENVEEIKNYNPTLHLYHPTNNDEASQIEINAIMEISLNEKINFIESEFHFDLEKFLTGLNLRSIEDSVETSSVLSEHFHQDRTLFVNLLWKFINHQISAKDLKIIFTDVHEKKVKEEIKTIVQTKVCSGATKEEISLASEMEANIFSVYNVKNPTFSIIGQKEETNDYFACFHLESVNFIVQFTELNEFNRLQKSILKLNADLLNKFAADKRIKVKKRKQETKPKVETQTITTVPASSTLH